MARNKQKEASVSVDVSTETAFEKAQLVGSARYARRRDLVAALLTDGEKYTFSQVDAMIEKFLGTDFTEGKGD